MEEVNLRIWQEDDDDGKVHNTNEMGTSRGRNRGAKLVLNSLL